MSCFAVLLCLVTVDQPAPKGYVCPKVNVRIEIDGKLDDDAWRDIPWTDDFVDIEGDAKPIPHYRTRAKMAWDDRYFYVAAEMEEPHVWGKLVDHDAVIFQDNDFELFIDPDGDNHSYYEVEINALNTEWDLFLDKPYRDGGPARNEWEIPGLLKAVHIRGTINDSSDKDEGWSVELAVPWEVLKEHANRPTPPRDGDQWRVNFSRVEWQIDIKDGRYEKVPKTPEANWVWSPQGAIDMHRPERWGYVQFSTEPPGNAAFRPDPDAATRDRLMGVYHAQRAFHQQNKRYAETLAALGMEDDAVTLTATKDGYEATVEGPSRRWRIRQDSRLRPVE